MTGKFCRLIEQRECLLTFIREKETERLLTDIFNIDKYRYLYEVLDNINMAILKEMPKRFN